MDPFAVQFFQHSLLSLLLVIKSVRIQKGSGDKKAFKQQTLRCIWVLEIRDYLDKMLNKHYRMLYLFFWTKLFLSSLKAVATSFSLDTKV